VEVEVVVDEEVELVDFELDVDEEVELVEVELDVLEEVDVVAGGTEIWADAGLVVNRVTPLLGSTNVSPKEYGPGLRLTVAL